jgi:hypothetical protein
MTDRREFIHRLALGATAAAVPGAAIARAPEAADEPKKPAENKPEAAKSETDVRMELILNRFGTHLDEAARKAVREELESIVYRAQVLRKFPLENGDGPFPIFQPYRSPLA